MKRTAVLKLLFVFICTFSVNCKTSILAQESNTFFIPDSLKNYSYKELYKKLNESENVILYSSAYLNKAKNEKDTLRITHGYSQQTSIYFSRENTDISIKYLDSIILIAKNKNYKDYPAYGYLWKGSILFIKGSYDKALENYLIAQSYAEKQNNIQQLLAIKQKIGSLKALWGNKNEAIEHFKYVIQKIDQPNIPEDYRLIVKSEAQIYLSYIFIQKKEFDSAYYYADKYLKLSEEQKLLQGTPNYNELIAEIELYKKNYPKTIVFLNKVKNKSIETTQEFNYNYIYGSALNGLNKKEEAFYYFSKADSIQTATKDLLPETRKVKEFFINYYKQKNDVKNQLLYIDQLLKVDSLININTRTLNTKIKKEYDQPQLLAEKEKIINNISKRSNFRLYLIIFLSALGLISILLFINYYKKQKKLKIRFQKLLDEDSAKKESNSEKTAIDEISKKIATKILEKLEHFEKENDFLQNGLTQKSLADKLNTNSNYLSKIVNYYKKKNFSSYISDLRINYVIKRLKTDKTFRKFSVKAIASEIGFNNTESFSKAFYAKTGLYPSSFIKELNKK